MLYRDERDKRVFVPKQGGGVAMNFAHPVAWAIVLCTTVIPLVIVAIVMIATFA